MKHYIIIALSVCMFAAGLLYAQDAGAEIYRYTDEKGSVHITDDKNSIPAKYRSKAIEYKPGKRNDGYTPDMSQAEGARETGADSWYDYDNMKWYERWLMLAKASTLDIKPILKAVSPWIGLVTMLLMVLYFYIFKIFEAPRKKGAAIFVVTGTAMVVVFYLFVWTVEKESAQLIKTVNKSTSSISENEQSLMDYLQVIQKKGE